MAHHLQASYDEEENLFLPPQRTLGFNPQLKINDSLLAHSYIEAYDISYPEAIRRIEGEVNELKQHLDNDGFYELNDLGRLFVNDEGNLEFEPCEAGILTPALYGLTSFEMPMMASAKSKVFSLKGLTGANSTTGDNTAMTDDEDSTVEANGGEHAITIKMSWVRNVVAVAAALLAFLLMTPPISNSEQPSLTMSGINLPIIQRDTHKVHQVSALDNEAMKEALDKRNTDNQVDKIPPVKEEHQTVTEPQPTTSYCIVLASHVSQANAEEYASKLLKGGLADVRVCVHNNVRRVVCGVYDTYSDAYHYLQDIHKIDGLSEAWVYKISD